MAHIRMSEVVRRTGLSRTTVYKYIRNDPLFPKRRYIQGNHRLMVFDDAELDVWLALNTRETRTHDTPSEQNLLIVRKKQYANQ